MPRGERPLLAGDHTNWSRPDAVKLQEITYEPILRTSFCSTNTNARNHKRPRSKHIVEIVKK
jgi:hypothetical protein